MLLHPGLLRIGEVVWGLNRKDIDSERGLIYIKEARGKDRYTYIFISKKGKNVFAKDIFKNNWTIRTAKRRNLYSWEQGKLDKHKKSTWFNF